MIEVRVLSDDTELAWDRFVEDCAEATFFHKAGWRRVIENSLGHQAHFLFAVEDGEICAVLPLIHVKSLLFRNSLISTAFTVGGGTAASSETGRQALDQHAVALCGELKAGFVEYRAPAQVPEGWAVRDDLYANFQREIAEDEDEALKQIPRKQRAVVRKSLKNDLGCQIDDTVDGFFNLYSASVHRLGTPVQAKAYFAALLAEFGPELCDVLTITADGQPMSSVLSFYFRGAVLPYFTGGAIEARKLGANDLMYWRLMRRARERGYDIFDFGRSKVGTGPFSFKKNWGFEPQPISHAFYLPEGTPIPDTNPSNPKYALVIKAWQRMPLWLANRVGPPIARGIG